MARGISLHVGINRPSSAFPNAPILRGCENDALAMEQIAEGKGFQTRDLLLGSDATYARVTTKILSAAAQLEAGDIFLFTFAGHGFQVVDVGTGQDELDFLDEAVLLFDVELLDDVLRKNMWPRFKAGVRVLMVADSCHSRSVFLIPGDTAAPVANDAVATEPPPDATPPPPAETDDFPVATGGNFVPREIPIESGREHQEEYAEFYRNLLIPIFDPPINASVLLLSACASDKRTGDGEQNGMYTAALLKVLKDPGPPKNYDDLVNAIDVELKKLGRDQEPQVEVAGVNDEANDAFRAQRPFARDE